MRQTIVMTWKELTQVANRPRFALLSAGLVAGLALLFAFFMYEMLYKNPQSVTPRDIAEFGRYSFWGAIAILTAALSLAALVVGSVIVVDEHANRRLELLLVTPLSASSIIGAKSVSVYARMAITLLVVLPLFALLSIFGGVDQYMVVSSLIFMIGNIWLYGSIGLFASVYGKTTTAALALAGILAVVWNLLPALYAFALYICFGESAANRVLNTEMTRHVFSTWSLFVFFDTLIEAPLRWRFVFSHAGVDFLAGAVLLATSFRMFRPAAQALVSGEKKGGRDKSLRRRRKETSKADGKERTYHGQVRFRLGGFFGEGLLGRELAKWNPLKAVLSLGWFVVLYVVVFLLWLATGEAPDLTSYGDNAILFMLEAIPFLFFLAVRASLKVVMEGQRRSMTALVLTPFRGGRILLSKFVSVAVEQSLGILYLHAHLWYILVIGDWSNEYAWVAFPGLTLATAFAIGLGICFSLSCRRTVEAVVVSALVWVFGPLAAALVPLWFEWLMGSRKLPSATAFAAGCAAAPFVAAAFLAGRKRGYGSWLAVVSYVLLLGVVLISWSACCDLSFDSITLFRTFPLMMPGMSTAIIFGEHDLEISLIMGASQAGLLLFFVASCLWSFEAQAKRNL